MEYYERPEVVTTILEFARAGNGKAVRESAFFNKFTQRIQRYFSLEHAERGQPLVLDSEADLIAALRAGATAFYCSYWRYPQPRKPLQPMGLDLVWTIRAKSGGLEFAKEVTAAAVEALIDKGLGEPWVKYSGELGFDLLIPLELVVSGGWSSELELLTRVQQALTRYLATRMLENFEVRGTCSPLEVKRGGNVCTLAELRMRRGLLLAPMSLNPRTGLVSLPIDPHRIEEFSVLEASPADARAYKWRITPTQEPELPIETQAFQEVLAPY